MKKDEPCGGYMDPESEPFRENQEGGVRDANDSEMDPLEEKVVFLLRRQKMTLTTAESCTAGLVAGRVMNVPGASGIYQEGYITYSNVAKERLLGVKKETLEIHGAVSEETAAEMAEGAAKAAGADAALSVTGVAGPDGGTKETPVGLIYIGCYVKGKVTVKECRFHGDRAQNRAAAVTEALKLLLSCLPET